MAGCDCYMLPVKRGMSPLPATILLIAFAISLGILIMSLGQQMHSEEEVSINASRICGSVSFSVSNISGHPSVCYNEEQKTVWFMGSNDGTKEITSMQVWVVGRKPNRHEVLENPLPPEGTLEKEVSYDASRYGTIREVKFIPRVRAPELNEPYLCVDYPSTVEDVDMC